MASYILYNAGNLSFDIDPGPHGSTQVKIFDLSKPNSKPLGVGAAQDPYRALGLALNDAIKRTTGKPTIAEVLDQGQE